jgi:phage terminase small subunit
MLGKPEQALAAERYMYIDDNGQKRRSPWLFVRSAGADIVARFGQLLGLSPAAKARMATPE